MFMRGTGYLRRTSPTLNKLPSYRKERTEAPTRQCVLAFSCLVLNTVVLKTFEISDPKSIILTVDKDDE